MLDRSMRSLVLLAAPAAAVQFSTQSHVALATDHKGFVSDKVFINENLLFCPDPDLLGVASSVKEGECIDRFNFMKKPIHSVKVCGVNMQIEIYSRHQCKSDSISTMKVGVCSKAVGTDLCVDVHVSATSNVWLKNALSFKLIPCPNSVKSGADMVRASGNSTAGDAASGNSTDASSDELKTEAEEEVAADEGEAIEAAEAATSPFSGGVTLEPTAAQLAALAEAKKKVMEPLPAKPKTRAEALGEGEDVRAESPAEVEDNKIADTVVEEEVSTTPSPPIVPFTVNAPPGMSGNLQRFDFKFPLIEKAKGFINKVTASVPQFKIELPKIEIPKIEIPTWTPPVWPKIELPKFRWR